MQSYDIKFDDDSSPRLLPELLPLVMRHLSDRGYERTLLSAMLSSRDSYNAGALLLFSSIYLGPGYKYLARGAGPDHAAGKPRASYVRTVHLAAEQPHDADVCRPYLPFMTKFVIVGVRTRAVTAVFKRVLMKAPNLSEIVFDTAGPLIKIVEMDYEFPDGIHKVEIEDLNRGPSLRAEIYRFLAGTETIREVDIGRVIGGGDVVAKEVIPIAGKLMILNARWRALEELASIPNLRPRRMEIYAQPDDNAPRCALLKLFKSLRSVRITGGTAAQFIDGSKLPGQVTTLELFNVHADIDSEDKVYETLELLRARGIAVECHLKSGQDGLDRDRAFWMRMPSCRVYIYAE